MSEIHGGRPTLSGHQGVHSYKLPNFKTKKDAVAYIKSTRIGESLLKGEQYKVVETADHLYTMIIVKKKQGLISRVIQALKKAFHIGSKPKSDPFVYSLHEAVKRGDLVRLGEMLEGPLKREINSCDESGSTPLHLAIEKGDLRMVRLLVCSGASIDVPKKISGADRPSPLRLALALKRPEGDAVKSFMIKAKWSQGAEKAKIIGKGLEREPEAKILDEKFWIEATDPRHPFGSHVAIQWLKSIWEKEEGFVNFYDWFEEKWGQFHHDPGSLSVDLTKAMVGYKVDSDRVGAFLTSVDYLNREEREGLEASVLNGKIIKGGKPYHSSKEGARYNSLFVISPGQSSKLFVFPFILGKRHHVSPLAGGAVKAAGEIITDEEGRLLVISDQTGHYQVHQKHMIAALCFFEEQGVDLTHVVVKMHDPETRNIQYFNALALLRSAEADPKSSLASSAGSTQDPQGDARPYYVE